MTVHKLAIGLAAVFMLSIRAQSQADPLTFEVASVKATPPDTTGGVVHQLPGSQTYEIKGAPLRLIMTVAYQVTDRQISGGPSWMESDRFDIMAKAARPRTSDELHVMLAHLLEERFQLKVRRENRQESVMALVVDKGGPKMPLHDPEDKVHEPFGGSAARGSDGLICPGLTGRNVAMNYFAFFLSRVLGRTVIDRTDLPAYYDVNVQFVGDGPRPNAPDGQQATGEEGRKAALLSPDCPDINAALPKQLGLRLEPGKGPVEYLVVEHAEKPTEN